MKTTATVIRLLALIAVSGIGTAKATAISSSDITLDLSSFTIETTTGYTITGYATGGNANAESAPSAPSNPAVSVGPFSTTTGWTAISPAVTNSVLNASSSGSSDAERIFNQASATADGVTTQRASAAAVVYHNVDFTTAAAGVFTFSIDYLINQSLSRSATEDTASANSQVSFEIRRSGGAPYTSIVVNTTDIKDEVVNRLIDNELEKTVDALRGTLSHTLDLALLDSSLFYSIGIQAYTQAYAETRDFNPVAVPAILPLILSGIGMLLLRRGA